MDSFNIKAYAKINLGLDITGKREDGYHSIRTLMQTIGLYDKISISKKSEADITMDCSDAALSVGEDNLCMRAVRIIEKEHGLKNGYHISLQKNIPMQAGLGGGSTDAAAVLKALNILENLGLSDAKLQEYSSALGADVAFFIKGGCCLCEGIGEILTPIETRLDCHTLLIKPDFDVSTRDAYKWLDDEKKEIYPPIDEIVSCIQKKDVLELGYRLENSNVFEPVVKKHCPKLGELLGYVKSNGALASCMSGSGSCVYGIFSEKADADRCKDSVLREFSVYGCFVTTFVS